MFKLLRYYSATSFIAVLATALILTWLCRAVVIQAIVEIAERNNASLAITALNPLKPALIEFLDSTDALEPGATSGHLPPSLAHSISSLMHDRSIVRIKIYNRQGVVVYSTDPDQIGSDQSFNPGVATALHGRVGTDLVYRDTFNSFDGATEVDNLLQTYLPVRADPAEPSRGVFELYADVNNLVQESERTGFLIMGGAMVVLLFLYAALVFIVRGASRTIETQQRAIRERSQTLELLAAQLLKKEELQKKQVAYQLHEGVAQTLVALKLQAENGNARKDRGKPQADTFVPTLQEAIHEVRTIATQLRPASLDELGLLPTLEGLCREVEQQHRPIRIEREFALKEADIPAGLKVILYRIVEPTLGALARQTDSGCIHLALGLEHDALVLTIADTHEEPDAASTAPNAQLMLRSGLARMEELATLSGGVFTAYQHSNGATTLKAAWPASAR